MAHSKENESAKELRKKVQDIKKKYLLNNLEIVLITRKTINTSKGARLVEITRGEDGIKWGRLVIPADKNFNLYQCLENPHNEYLEQRMKTLLSVSPTINVYEEMKEAGLESIRAANTLIELNGGRPCFLYHLYEEDDPIEESKYPNRIRCGVERYNSGGRAGKERNPEVGRKNAPELINEYNRHSKRRKDAKEKAAIRALEWATELSEWTGEMSVYIHGKGNKIVAIRSGHIVITADGKISGDQY